MAAASATTLPFLLISLFILFIYCSHIISCFAIAITTTNEGQGQGQGQVPSSVTPKAAAVHYWHLKTRNNKPLPPVILSKLSPLSPTKMITTNDEATRANGDKVKMGKIDAPQDRHPTASDDGGENFPLYSYHDTQQDHHVTVGDDGENFPLYSYHDTQQDHHVTVGDDGENFPLYSYHDTQQDHENFPLYSYHDTQQDHDVTASDDGGENLLLYRYFDTQQDHDVTASDDGDENLLLYRYFDTQQDHDVTVGDMMHAKSATNHYNVDPNNNIKMVRGDEIKEKAAKQISPRQRGIFLRESELKEGKTIPLLKFAGRSSGQYFLPRSIASKIPFSANATSKIFHVPTDSALYREMESTIGHCRMPPNKGETKQCITSAEDMIDYALSSLGANADIQVWSTNNSTGFGGKGLIGKVKVVYDGELTGKPHLTCHEVIFPYLVFHCHSVYNTRLYDIEILDAETKENINRAAAVCHLDTKGWDPKHGSFAELSSAPGMTEVCHWMPPWDMTLTASDAAAATATVAE